MDIPIYWSADDLPGPSQRRPMSMKYGYLGEKLGVSA